MKNGRADERGDDADLDLLRAGDDAADDVGCDEQRRARRARQNGSSQRWSVPTSRRQRWGMTRPTNAIGPATAVAAPHRMTAPADGDQPRAEHVARRGPRRGRRPARASSCRARSAGRSARRSTRNGQHHGDAIPRRAADAADLPEAERRPCTSTRGSRIGADERGERRRGRGAGQRELERSRAAAPERADGVDEDGRAPRRRRWRPRM